MRDFAERLIADEARGKKSPGAETPATFVVWEKLRPHLAMLMGKTGSSALLARALALAAPEAPGLRAVQIQADGSLAGGEESGAPAQAEELAEGSVALLAELLGLLEAFIGERLTVQLLQEVWPKLTLSALYFNQPNKNEKAN